MNIVVSYDLITTEANKRTSDYNSLTKLFGEEWGGIKIGHSCYFVSFNVQNLSEVMKLIISNVLSSIEKHKDDKFYIAFNYFYNNKNDLYWKQII